MCIEHIAWINHKKSQYNKADFHIVEFLTETATMRFILESYNFKFNLYLLACVVILCVRLYKNSTLA